MLDLFYQGGPLFMGILTLVLLVVLVLSFVYGSAVFTERLTFANGGKDKIALIKSVGLFALIVGVLGQLIGLYEAFKAIQKMGEVSPAMLAGGIRISMITTLYGFLIAIMAYLIYFGLQARLR